MPHFVLNHGQSGPLIDIWVALSKPKSDLLTSQNIAVPPPVLVKGLIDTGASHTMIDMSVVAALGLTPTGSVDTITPTTGAIAIPMTSYDVGIFIPFPFPAGYFYPKLIWVVTGGELLHQGFSVLIGRDLLSEGTLFYDGRNGTFTLSF